MSVFKQLLKAFGSSLREAGERGLRNVELPGVSAPPARSIPSVSGPARQGELFTRTGAPQNFTGGRTPFIRTTEVTPRGAADVVPTSAVRPEAPGQLNILGRETVSSPAPSPQFRMAPRPQGPISPTALKLATDQPGTYKSIQELAERASTYYGKPVTVDDLVGPGGTDFLKRLEAEAVPGALVRSAGGGMRPPTPPGALSTAQRQAGELVPSPGGALKAPEEVIDVSVRELNNAVGGLRTLDLKKALGLAGVGVGLGTGLAAFRQKEEPGVPGGGLSSPAESIPTPMGPTSANPELGPVNDPMVAAPGQTFGPGAGADYRGVDGQTVIVTPGDRDETLRAMKQQYVSKPNTPARQLEDYYRQRETYAKAPQINVKVISELTKRGELGSPELLGWAQANPTLAYELLRQKYGVSDVMNQQMPQVKQYETGTSLGTNNSNNFVGNVQASAQSALGQQGASDIAAATRPQLYERIENLPPSSAVYSAAASSEGMGANVSPASAENLYARLRGMKFNPAAYGAVNSQF